MLLHRPGEPSRSQHWFERCSTRRKNGEAAGVSALPAARGRGDHRSGADEKRQRLPRKSRDMADCAPGVRVDRTDGTAPPAATLLQPGDLVLFHADSGDDQQTATADHVGIHLGEDAAGQRRSLSGRRTVDGPAMADLGGASPLDGTGTYARTLHTVHRIRCRFTPTGSRRHDGHGPSDSLPGLRRPVRAHR
ncbi:hypothetical protein [Streptomyces sp. NPDC057238]|uniref:hypothetical protein n=1 Tax=Streptomyces sp. NPDC057238 TaxID=3346060 RepID=UPI0036435A22